MVKIEVYKHEQRIEGLLKLVKEASTSGSRPDDEIAHQCRYICILISGYCEEAIREIISGYVLLRANPQVSTYVKKGLDGFYNPNSDNIKKLIGKFSSDYSLKFGSFIQNHGRKEALDSIVSLKNNIAHGKIAGVGLVQISEYYYKTKECIHFLMNEVFT